MVLVHWVRRAAKRCDICVKMVETKPKSRRQHTDTAHGHSTRSQHTVTAHGHSTRSQHADTARSKSSPSQDYMVLAERFQSVATVCVGVTSGAQA